MKKKETLPKAVEIKKRLRKRNVAARTLSNALVECL